MARRRVAVALVPPDDLANQVQALRRSVADPRIDELPPHLTLIPPINLGADDMRAARRLLRRSATASEPFDLRIGPATSFAPATPTLHLEVSGDVEELVGFRAGLRVAPFDRPDNWPFVPHVTLREELDDPARSGAIAALTGRLPTWNVDRVFLLEQIVDDLGRAWVPVAEETFGGPAVVGRGGIELALRTLRSLEPEVLELFADPGPEPPAPVVGRWRPSDGRLVVAVELPSTCGEPVGALVGRVVGEVARIERIVVTEPNRGVGIGRHLAERWMLEAARRGSSIVIADEGVADALLRSVGFTTAGTVFVRQLPTGVPE